MSFILDALTKAERTRSRVPTLATIHPPARESRRTLGLAVAAGMLLTGGGIMVWLFWPSPSTLPPAATDFGARLRATTPAIRVNPERRTAPVEPENVPTPSPVARAPQQPATGRDQEDLQLLTRAPLANPSPIHAPPTQPSVPGGYPGAAGTADPIEGKSIPSGPVEPRRAEPTPSEPSPPPLAEASQPAARTPSDVVTSPAPPLPVTPPSLQQAMAKMTLDVFVYTGVKADRMVVINGRRYVQGQYVDGLYLLEDITPEGAVLTYQGERGLLRP